MSIFGKLDLSGLLAPIPDRPNPVAHGARHFVNGRPLDPPFPGGTERVLFGMGCFWGAERKFWRAGEGVHVTAVGYAGGTTKNPTYQDVCTGRTGHAEVVLVAYDPAVLRFAELLRIFWESHDPTQGMRQGNDVGTQYRSVIFTTTPTQQAAAEESRRAYQTALDAQGFGPVTTEIAPAPPFYYAEEYHQQYLAKNPGGYCGLGGTGVACQVGVGRRGLIPRKAARSPRFAPALAKYLGMADQGVLATGAGAAPQNHDTIPERRNPTNPIRRTQWPSTQKSTKKS
jgi:peptide-methionine (S)-S-oxide reductase